MTMMPIMFQAIYGAECCIAYLYLCLRNKGPIVLIPSMIKLISRSSVTTTEAYTSGVYILKEIETTNESRIIARDISVM
jgi:hypothetical protein